MASFYGNFFNRSSHLCAFPAFPRDQGYVIEVAIDETITKPVVCLQAAILHSTCNGMSSRRNLLIDRGTKDSSSYGGYPYNHERRRCFRIGRSNCDNNIPVVPSGRESIEFWIGKCSRRDQQ